LEFRPSGRPYPKKIIDIGAKARTEAAWRYITSGRYKVILVFGQSKVAKGALKGIRDLAEDWDDESRETFHVSITKLRLWEMGVECEELTMLRHDSIGPERPFPQNAQFEPLSSNHAKSSSK